jgi:hypothetical protein
MCDMSGFQLTASLASSLAWPAVLIAFVAFAWFKRSDLVSLFDSRKKSSERPLKRFKAGPVEFEWNDVKETVNSQIEVAEKIGETSDTLRELKVLRDRLDVLRRTGSVPEHPAETYDRSVEAALRRLFPNFEVVRQPGRSNRIADFIVRNPGDQLYVETKWRADTARPFGGTTIPRLAQNLPPEAKLLIVVNTAEWQPSATEYIESALRERGRIVAWRDVRDDPELADAVAHLLRVGKRQG